MKQHVARCLRTRALLPVVMTSMLACGGNSSDGNDRGLSMEGSGASDDDAPSDNGIEEQQVDGVWLFWHAFADHGDALLTGPASIVDGCLRVGGYVVVWHESWLTDVESAVQQVAAGASRDFSLGGGEAGGTWPATIEARCGTAPVWAGSPVK